MDNRFLRVLEKIAVELSIMNKNQEAIKKSLENINNNGSYVEGVIKLYEE